MPAGCLIDGEAVAIDDDGKPSFQLLQSTLKGGDAPLAFYAFDLLIDCGEDIRKLPNIERKERLAALLEGVSPPILYGDHIIGRGEEMFDAVCKQGGEGIISKKASATYQGTRTRNWLKIKCIQRQEFVIVGWSESDKRRGFRSLLLAAKDKGKLTYAGKVGTGFNARLIEELMERMEPLAVDKAALEVPRADRKSAHWIEPKLVAEINFAEFTDDGILRHPSFVALREDKPAKDVVKEVPKPLSAKEAKPKRSRGKKAAHASAADFGIEISSADRVIFPDNGVTKGELADYYATVEPLIMVDAAKRPMTLIRYPQGTTEKGFFQKHDTGTFGPHVKHVPIKESDGDIEEYLFFDDIRGLLACVQMGTIDVPRLDAGEQAAVDVVEEEIVFEMPVALFWIGTCFTCGPRCTLVVLLEKAFSCAALGISDQGHRPLRRIDHDQRLDRRIIIGEVVLGEAPFREDDAIGAADLDPEILRRCMRRVLPPGALRAWLALSDAWALPHHVLRRLVFAQPDEARVAEDAVVGEFGEGDLGDQLGLDKCAPLRSARGTSSGALSTASGSIRSISSSISSR